MDVGWWWTPQQTWHEVYGCRPFDNPIGKNRAIAILKGNLALEGLW